MKRVAVLGLLVVLAVVQVTWAPRFAVGGAFPNLVLLVVVGATWTAGARPAMAWACVGGVLLDLTAPGAIGPHAVALLAGVYATSFWTRNVERVNALHLALTAALSTVLYSVTLVLTAGLLGMPAPDPTVALRLTLAAAAYNALLMPLAGEVMRRVPAMTHAAPEAA